MCGSERGLQPEGNVRVKERWQRKGLRKDLTCSYSEGKKSDESKRVAIQVE